MKKSNQKNLVIFSKYEKKKQEIKPYIITHTNKDKSISRYGVSKQGHRFYEKILKEPSNKILNKNFNKFKSQKNIKKNNVTAQLIRYEGKFLAKNKVIKGKQHAKYFFNIDKKQKRISKNGLMTEYTNKLQEIINVIDMITY